MSVKLFLNFLYPYQPLFRPKPFIKKILSLKKANQGIYAFTFLNNPELKKMNKTFLQHHYNTDVISFNLGDVETPEADIYISVDQAQKNAKKEGHSLDDEIKLLIVHGILHTLGYTDDTPDQKKEMDQEQNRLIKLATILT